jgi:hypothetical protein
MDPSQPLNANVGFTQVDPNTGTPATVTNQNANYGWEYVWHCHILGHEENDFMRPVKFNVLEAKPATPTALTAIASGAGALLNWTDNATTEYAYKVERRVGTTGAWTDLTATAQPLIGAAPVANANTFTDTSTLQAGTTYSYQVTAIGAAGNSAVATATYTTPAAATTLGAPTATAPTAPSRIAVNMNNGGKATVTWRDNSNNETGFTVQRSTNRNFTAATTVTLPAVAANATTTSDTGLTRGTTYFYRVASANGTVLSTWNTVAQGTTAR